MSLRAPRENHKSAARARTGRGARDHQRNDGFNGRASAFMSPRPITVPRPHRIPPVFSHLRRRLLDRCGREPEPSSTPRAVSPSTRGLTSCCKRYEVPRQVPQARHPAQAGRRRRVAVATVCVQCAMAVSGCGEDAPRNSPVATAPATSPPTAADPPLLGEPEVPECDVAGINERVGRQGTCVTGGVTRTVADRHRRLVLDDSVEIRLQDLAVRPRGSGRIVVASLRVRNLGRGRIRWPMTARQVALWVDGALIAQDPSGRLLALKAIRPSGKPSVVLAAAGVSTVAVGWRLSAATAAGLRRRGSAIIVVPPHGGGSSVDVAARIGVLRLWK